MTDLQSLDQDGMEMSSCCSDESFHSMDASCSEDESFSFDTDEEDMLSVSSENSDEKAGLYGDVVPEVVAVEEGHASPSANSSPDLLTVFEGSGCLPQVIKQLSSNEGGYTHLKLCFRVIEANGCTKNFSALLKAIRCNQTVTKCTVGSECFLGLNMFQTRALVDAIGGLSALKTLVLNSCAVEFLTTLSYCTKWKRDQHYHLYFQHCEFRNRSVEEVLITGVPSDIVEGFLGHLAMLAIFNFGVLERLNVNFVDDYSNPQEALMRVALTALSYSKNLMDIKFGHGIQHFIMEVSASRNAEVLRVLKLRCSGQDLSSQSYMAIAQMLHMHSKTLNGLVLETAVDNDGALTIAKTLGYNSNLKALCLGTFDCRNETRRDGLVSLLSRVLCPQLQHAQQQQQHLHAVTRQNSLEYLSLVCQELDDAGIQEIGSALSESSLRELILFLDNELDTTISGRGIAALAKVLEVNQTIEDFSLICNALDDDGLMAIASVLKKKNRTLKHLKLQCSNTIKVTSRGYEAVVEMLKENTVLESFDLGRIHDPDEDEEEEDEDDMENSVYSVPAEVSRAINFYTKLNHAGVRELNFNTAPGHFLNAIVSQRSEIDNLYYMLSMNPSFVSFGSQEA